MILSPADIYFQQVCNQSKDMDDPEIPHQRVAEKLRTPRDTIDRMMSDFNEAPIGAVARAVLLDRVEMFAQEHTRKLLTVKPDELRYVQGLIEGLRLAGAAIETR